MFDLIGEIIRVIKTEWLLEFKEESFGWIAIEIDVKNFLRL